VGYDKRGKWDMTREASGDSQGQCGSCEHGRVGS